MKLIYPFILLLLLLTLSGFASSTVSDSVAQSDSLDFDSQRIIKIVHRLDSTEKHIHTIISPGRVLSRKWYNAGGYLLLPVFINYNGMNQFDPFNIPADLSLLPSDEHHIDDLDGLLTIQIDSLKMLKPYTNLHYEIGSYQYKNLFVRHRQILGRWIVDFHGQNVGGDDGHPYNNGDQSNLYGSLIYQDSHRTYYELRYNAWRTQYRYNPWYSDSSIVRLSRENMQTDNWSLHRVCNHNILEKSEAGILFTNHGGHWYPAKNDEQAIDYQTFGGFYHAQRVVLGNLLNAHINFDYYSGKSRKGDIGRGMYSLHFNGDYLFEIADFITARITVLGGLLPSLSYGKTAADLFIGKRIRIQGGSGFLPKQDDYGVYSDQTFGDHWLNFQMKMLTFEQFDLTAGVENRYFSGIFDPVLGYGFENQAVNVALVKFNFHNPYFTLSGQLRHRLSGFVQIPEQYTEIKGLTRFRLISRLFIRGEADFKYAHNYAQFDFDSENYFLKAASSIIENSMQLDIEIAAQVKNFEIYYKGIHLDGFLTDGYDFAFIKGFANNLPRYRIGVRWILFN